MEEVVSHPDVAKTGTRQAWKNGYGVWPFFHSSTCAYQVSREASDAKTRGLRY